MSNEYAAIRDFLRETGKTDEDMQMMWDYCISCGHRLICQLDRSGVDWTGLNVHALKTLETEYKKLLEDDTTLEGGNHDGD